LSARANGRFPHASSSSRIVLCSRRGRQLLNLPDRLRDWDPSLPPRAGTLDVLHLPLAADVHPGR
jgi:hypothetical protein